MYGETLLRSKTSKSKTQHSLEKGTTDSSVQTQCTFLSVFQGWLQFSLCFDAFFFFKQCYELVLGEKF